MQWVAKYYSKIFDCIIYNGEFKKDFTAYFKKVAHDRLFWNSFNNAGYKTVTEKIWKLYKGIILWHDLSSFHLNSIHGKL